MTTLSRSEHNNSNQNDKTRSKGFIILPLFGGMAEELGRLGADFPAPDLSVKQSTENEASGTWPGAFQLRTRVPRGRRFAE